MSSVRFIVLLALVSLTGDGAAQVFAVSPPNPTSADIIVLSVRTPELGFILQSVTVTGSTIDVTFRGGSDVPAFENHEVTLPRLSPGTHAVTVTFVFLLGDGEIDHVSTVPPFMLQVLRGAAIPALNLPGLLVLLASLSALALRRL